MAVHDLEALEFVFEGVGIPRERITAQCPRCQATHSQTRDLCPDCGLPVVWRGSRVWKKLYGDPEEALRRLQGQGLEPATEFQKAVVQQFGYRGQFQNLTQKKDTLTLERRYPVAYLEQLLEWSKGKKFAAFRSACHNSDNLRAWQAEHDDIPSWQKAGTLL